MASSETAVNILNKIINKSRVHFYKPTQIAEILHRSRVERDIHIKDLSTYRSKSKKWRDDVSSILVGRVSTSSTKFQDNLFEQNALLPIHISRLDEINKEHSGIVEEYIYSRFKSKLSQLSTALDYCGSKNFQLNEFLGLFWNEPGLKRSMDKVYEIIVYALFSTLIDALEVSVKVSLNVDKNNLLKEFSDFALKTLNLSETSHSIELPAKIYRAGVTNAADRGLDMWGNFGLAIQVKRLTLTKKIAESVATEISAGRVVLVCKDSEKEPILSLLDQIGWKSRVLNVVTEEDLSIWYGRSLCGVHSELLGNKLLRTLAEEIKVEFPSSGSGAFDSFIKQRNYNLKRDFLSLCDLS